MKILYHILYPQGLGDDRMLYEGYKYAFEDLGYQIIPLSERDDIAQKLDEIKPDLFITSFNTIDFFKYAPIYKNYRQKGGKIFMRAGYISENDKDLIDLIKNNLLADKYFADLEVPHFEKLTGHKIELLALAANKKYHFPTKPSKKYQCDIIFIGAKLPRKEELFKRRLYPLFKKYNVKVYGGGWDFMDKFILRPLSKVDRKFNLGGIITKWRLARQVPLHEENQAYASAKICLNFHEQLPGGLFLLNGRTFRIPACGGFEICDFVPLARRYFNEDELVMAKDDADFFKKIDYFMTHEKERREIQERGTKRALRDHTYHNRAQQILSWYKDFK